MCVESYEKLGKLWTNARNISDEREEYFSLPEKLYTPASRQSMHWKDSLFYMCLCV